jgi:hypothetical protein
MRIRALPALFGAALRVASATAAFVVASSLSSPAPVHATLAREITLRQLVVRADLAVDGTAEESTTVWENVDGAGKRIVTYTRVHVGETVFGAGGKDVWVRTLGGIVGEIGQTVEGEAELHVGERAVFFLHAREDGTHVIVDMAQGHFPVAVAVAGAQPAPSETPVARLRLSPRLGGLVKQVTKEPLARVLLRDKPLAEAIKLVRDERKAAGL